MPKTAALLLMDRALLRLLPPLRVAWGWRGRQVEVPISGHNAGRALSGTIDLRTGHRVVLRRKGTERGGSQAFLRELRRRYRGRPVWLLLGSAPCQTAAGSQSPAAELGIELIELVWLPKQAAELDGMDRPWKELKRETSADRQYEGIEEHADQAEFWILTLAPTEALRKAGMLPKNFWLPT